MNAIEMTREQFDEYLNRQIEPGDHRCPNCGARELRATDDSDTLFVCGDCGEACGPDVWRVMNLPVEAKMRIAL